jgi:sterol desaturase/sphingolipid hydroxylase (fatty acid hydroxylase superfamily)
VEHRPFGIAGGAVVGILVAQFVGYWWHRALHRVPLLWRFHQMRHSAERAFQPLSRPSVFINV